VVFAATVALPSSGTLSEYVRADIVLESIISLFTRQESASLSRVFKPFPKGLQLIGVEVGQNLAIDFNYGGEGLT